MLKNSIFVITIISLLLSCATNGQNWQEIPVTRECKPWTYWWWLGSAVDKTSLSHQLQDFADAGFGGVHIVPIYGVKGYEEQFIDYLSPEWMGMLAYTVKTANELRLGVDMTTGTGWPFGGPQIAEDNAAKLVQMQSYKLSTGEQLTTAIQCENERYREHARLVALMAYDSQHQAIDLLSKVDSDSRLQWTAPNGDWLLVALFQSLTGQKVKRAAPGAEGRVMDYFSGQALQQYLTRFDTAFASYSGQAIRAMYNDSYEVSGADWTDIFLAKFKKRRGYDLTDYLWALAENASPDTVARVKCDYRETISDLLLEEFTLPWIKWNHDHHRLTRNQAHGSPANLLDLYATADIPETEIFGPSGFPIPGLRTDPDFPTGHRSPPDPLMMKFASSAAHVTGKKLTSSETCTWLGEHFRVALSQAKPEIDQLFLGGINHVFYHGIAYSPDDEQWPGWLFYASTNFGPSNSFWHDLPAMNGYIARCQSYLQHGQPDNDILLYWPVYDLWQNPEGWLDKFTVHNLGDWLQNTSFYSTAKQLWDRGFTFDYVSDRQLASVENERSEIHLGETGYKVIVVPACQFVPIKTLQRLLELAENGATVIFMNELPGDVPGLARLEDRRDQLQQIKKRMREAVQNEFSICKFHVGQGRWLVGDSLETMLQQAQIRREALADYGLQFIRRQHQDGDVYFLANLGDEAVSDWVPFSASIASAVLVDPRLEHSGSVAFRKRQDGSCEIFLQLKPGESRILWTNTNTKTTVEPWHYYAPVDASFELGGEWQVAFIDGGPELPSSFKTKFLDSWANRPDPAAQRFAGTARYTLTFEIPAQPADDWLLDLGRVCESANVKLNGENIGTLYSIPFELSVGRWLHRGSNTLKIDVTNLSANRIRDLDKRKVEWRKFYDINFVNINYKPFDASEWPLMDSGLLGPVKLIPVNYLTLR